VTLTGDFVTGQSVPFARMRDLLETLGIVRSGIISKLDFKVSQRGAGANMSVDVAAGEALVKVTTGTANGICRVRNDAVVNVTIAAAHATLPRIDLVCLQYNDTSLPAGTGGNVPTVRAVSGTATSGATLANLTGAAAVPADSLLLAYVLVPAASSSVIDSRIGGFYKPWNTSAGAVAGAPPAYALGRPANYVPSVGAYAGTTQALSDTVETAVNFGSEEWDTDSGMHDTVTNNSRITCLTPGMYSFVGQVAFASNATGIRETDLKLNGASYVADTLWGASPGFETIVGISSQYPMGYGDYMQLMALQTGNASLNINASTFSNFRATWIGSGA
jgi:hypothetical protein